MLNAGRFLTVPPLKIAQKSAYVIPQEVVDCIFYVKFDEEVCELAILILDWTIAKEPNNAKAFADRGGVFETLGDYDKAIADYSKAIDIEPRNHFNYFFRGRVYEDAGQNDLAVADYKKVLELVPGDAQAITALDRLGAGS